ncbi:hypothetical protein ELZ19_06765 [Brucella abortus]|uniref:hypothetical protein n=1 Tax=Brucella abortus TaxID=235 RepID=UPI0004E97F54|nr:hypothetical protein [Brucella abortus]KFH18419.1 hypothetical protein IB60_17060 [Brucella abortus LMN1]RUQ67351.1 hypothetical protein ELZ23_15600 [Brucella abortus]RUQ77621.1 hypothetical protein ELZ22_17670 [Brucella abortus]RUQ88262.1 hypothetical protein ELZ18_15480 [Brucella abortus]RUQ90291.1 hypothetical protein ELZ20_15475 [Brucella abortus]
MPYLGPTERVERIASARSNKFGYKAVIVTRRHAPGGNYFDQTHVVSKTLPTREEAIAFAQRRIDRLEAHLQRRQ